MQASYDLKVTALSLETDLASIRQLETEPKTDAAAGMA
jgi:hypothetical protein